MGDLAGYTVTLMCCACHEKYPAQVWRGDRLRTYQLCEPCRIGGYTIDRERVELMKDGRRVRILEKTKDAFNVKDGEE